MLKCSPGDSHVQPELKILEQEGFGPGIAGGFHSECQLFSYVGHGDGIGDGVQSPARYLPFLILGNVLTLQRVGCCNSQIEVKKHPI